MGAHRPHLHRCPGSPAPAPAIPGRLLINEVLSKPGSTWNCSEPIRTFTTNSDSWVELYNPQSQPYNLYAAHARLDTGPNTLAYYLPLDAAIASHGYPVLFPSTPSGSLATQANLRLVIAGVAIDQVNIPAVPIDQSSDLRLRIPLASAMGRKQGFLL
jgi:hypothetical protein